MIDEHYDEDEEEKDEEEDINLIRPILSIEKMNQQISDYASKTPTKKIYTKRELHRLRWSTCYKSKQKHQLQTDLYLLSEEIDTLKVELIEAETQHKPITIIEQPTRGRKPEINGLKVTEAQAKKIMEMLVSSGVLDEDAMASLQQVD